MSKTITEQQCEFTHAFALLIMKAVSLGYAIKVCELNRDIETQKRYVAEGKSKTINSKHLDKLAVDLALVVNGTTHTSGEVFRPLGEYWEQIGGRWGGRFGLEKEPKDVQDKQLGWDSPHFEWRINA